MNAEQVLTATKNWLDSVIKDSGKNETDAIAALDWEKALYFKTIAKGYLITKGLIEVLERDES